MNVWQAIVLSIIEGLTEFLPISSTAHLVLTANVLHIAETDFVKSFEIFIQLGAILAVVILYWKTLWHQRELWSKIVLGFIPTGVLGLIFYKIVKTYLIGNIQVTLIALLSGGFILVLLEKYYNEKVKHLKHEEKMTWWQAVTIGFFQAVSMIPGVSRSAATISGGLLLGLSREAAVEFSFLLAIPTMLAASSLDLVKSFRIFTPQEYLLLMVGFVGSFLSAVVGVKVLVNFIKNHSLVAFGFYRIILVIVFLIFLTVEKTNALAPQSVVGWTKPVAEMSLTESSGSALVFTPGEQPTNAYAQAPKVKLAVPILNYHYIGLNPNPKDTLRFALSVTPTHLDEQLAYLKAKGYTPVDLNTLQKIFNGEVPVPTKPIVLTFDDGYIDFFVNAFPIIKKYGFTVVVFIPTGLMNQGYYLSWEQIKEMAASGLVDFEDHSVSHPNLTKLGYTQILKQFVDSRQKLQAETGQSVNFVAYPYGLYSNTVIKAAHDAGFVGAVTTRYGLDTGISLTMPRININGYTSEASFEARVKE